MSLSPYLRSAMVRFPLFQYVLPYRSYLSHFLSWNWIILWIAFWQNFTQNITKVCFKKYQNLFQDLPGYPGHNKKITDSTGFFTPSLSFIRNVDNKQIYHWKLCFYWLLMTYTYGSTYEALSGWGWGKVILDIIFKQSEN